MARTPSAAAGNTGAKAAPRPRRSSRPAAPAPAHDLVLHVALHDVAPPVWRRLRVPDRLTLHQLHRVLQLAFGWLDYHLYEFRPATAGRSAGRRARGAPDVREIPTVRYAEADPEWDDAGGAVETRDSRRVTLRDLALAPGARLTYLYDFGDDWAHDITVEQVVTAQRRGDAEDEGESLPMLLDGARAGPPEDAGGAHGYARLLDVLADPDDPEHAEMTAWAALWGGAAYDPERFDPWTANHTLMLVAAWGAL